MRKIIVAIVSHGHTKYIESNHYLEKINYLPNVTVIVKDNIKDNDLKSLAADKGYRYLVSERKMGFGENNNQIFSYAKKNLDVTDNDWFLIINPDVSITVEEFSKLIKELNNGEGNFYTPNLFKDDTFTTYENSIRYYANYLSLLNLFKMKSINPAYNKDLISDYDEVEWSSGAFLCITFGGFDSVGGFNVDYFMYYEDVDLCFRLRSKGVKLKFLKSVRAVHKGEYKNRNIFSKHFFWYVTSLLKFLNSQSIKGSLGD